MPNNPHQPRDPNGQYGSLPPRIPTAAAGIPHLPSDASVEDRLAAIEAAFAALQNQLRAVGLPTTAEEMAALAPQAHRPDASRPDEAEWARTYHKRFRNFHRAALRATDELFRARPSQLEPEERKVVFKTWVDTISDIYGMERPAFHWDASADHGGGGFYRPADHSITMSPNHPSVITLIHETRHALQHTEKGAPMVTDDVERDARAWSLSLYYKVRPTLLKRLVREGRVFHIDPTVFDQPAAATPAADE